MTEDQKQLEEIKEPTRCPWCRAPVVSYVEESDALAAALAKADEVLGGE